jgi:hypothetical protein
MRYTGHVEKGVVVFDGSARPPEGAAVQVEDIAAGDSGPTWGEVFKDLIGSVEGLPEDMAENHDHYIHGAPKNGDSNR